MTDSNSDVDFNGEMQHESAPVTAIDLFCGRGGVGLALSKLGIEHVGIDIEPYGDTYPGEFIQADASDPPISYSPDLLWLSPPCLAYSTLSYANGPQLGFDDPREYYDTFDDLLIRETIERLDPAHYIIENVATCEDLRSPTRLNGHAFGLGFDLERHFETSFPCPHALKSELADIVVNTRSGRSQSAAELAAAKQVPLEWGKQAVRSAIPFEFVQYLLHYCPLTSDVPLPQSVRGQQAVLPGVSG